MSAYSVECRLVRTGHANVIAAQSLEGLTLFLDLEGRAESEPSISQSCRGLLLRRSAFTGTAQAGAPERGAARSSQVRLAQCIGPSQSDLNHDAVLLR